MQICFFFFFWLSCLQERRIFTLVLGAIFALILVRWFVNRFLCKDFCADFCARCADFPQISAQIFHNFSSGFWRFKSRCSRVTQKCTQDLRKYLRRPNGLSREGSLLHLCCLEKTASHTIAAKRSTLGPKGLLSFAPRFIKYKNLRKFCSATHYPVLPFLGCLDSLGFSFSKEFPWLFGCFPWFFQGFWGFGREGKSLINWGVFLDKTEQPKGRKDRVASNKRRR